jgi:macrophage erythroblast attacher
MALPNGNVYGRKALEAMAAENRGMVTCPRDHRTYPFSKVMKVFVM